jgi:hypothetical protein
MINAQRTILQAGMDKETAINKESRRIAWKDILIRS